MLKVIPRTGLLGWRFCKWQEASYWKGKGVFNGNDDRSCRSNVNDGSKFGLSKGLLQKSENKN